MNKECAVCVRIIRVTSISAFACWVKKSIMRWYQAIGMNSDAERTLGNLNVLGSMSQNDKLLTNQDHFNIYTPTTFRAIMRTWYGERRCQNVQRIRTTIRNGIIFAQTFLDDATRLLAEHSLAPSPNVVDGVRLRIDTMVLQHIRMCDALRVSTNGLTSMLQTYRDDAALSSQLTGLIQEITDFLSVIEPYSKPVRQRIGSLTNHPPSSASTLLSPFPRESPRPTVPALFPSSEDVESSDSPSK